MKECALNGAALAAGVDRSAAAAAATAVALAARWCAAAAAAAAASQELTLVHFSAQRKHILRDMSGA
jgi:hypothetical protein